MRTLKLTFVLLTLGFISCSNSASDNLLNDLNEYKNCYRSENFAKMATFILPSVIEDLGGESEFVSLMESSSKTFKEMGFMISQTKFGEPSPFMSDSNYILSIIPTEIPIKTDEKKGYMSGSVIAFSQNSGDSWFFVEGSEDGIAKLSMIIPELSSDIGIPTPEMQNVIGNDTITLVNINGNWVAKEQIESDEQISLIKNGVFTSYPNKSIGEGIENYFSNTRWEKIYADDGHTYVNATGGITYMDEEATALLQFKVLDKENFEVNALEINDIPQTEAMINVLINNMFEDYSEDNNSGAGSNDLELVEHELVTDEWGDKSIVGIVRNNSSKEFESVYIEFNLYDSENNRVGTALDNIENFEPNGTWKFEAGTLDGDYDSYKFKEIKVYSF